MAVFSESDTDEKILALQLAFKQRLSSEINEMEREWEAVCHDADNSNSNSNSRLQELYKMADNLAGSGGSLGALDVSSVARELEEALDFLLKEYDKALHLSSGIQQQIAELLIQLRQATDKWQPSGIPHIQPSKSQDYSESQLVYLSMKDEALASALLENFEQTSYRVQHFTKLSDFEAACKHQTPVAIVMEVDFIDEDVVGADRILQLTEKMDVCPSVMFISARDDIEARLAAARAGAQRYFTKPVKVKRLIRSLDGLTTDTSAKPYRVLLVDDDEALMEYHAIVLREAGMEVETLSRPLQGLKVLTEFKPDIVVMDVYMPDCSGPELAQIIRQDDAWSLMPIVFLSGERGLERQLAAMNLGADDFLVKPVDAGHLVASIVSRVKRAHKTAQLTIKLKKALTENKFQLATMDEHDIVSTADVTGKITSVNDRFCQISGYSEKELLGQNHRMLKSGFHPSSFYEDMWQSISHGKIWRGTICNLNKSGEEYWVESTIVPFLDDKGKPYKYVSARTDMTELRKSEDRLHRSQLFANIGTWDWNIKTGDLYWSERIGPLFGYTEKDIETTYDNFLAAVHDDDRQMVVDAVNNCVENGANYNIEHRVVWQDGSVHWVQESGDVVRSEDGTPLHMLGVVQDIDTRKRAELALAERERQLHDAQSMAHLGNWTANIVSGELSWSDEIYRIFGYEPGSFKPSVEVFKKAVHPDDLALVEASEKKAEKMGYHDVVHRIVQPDGTVRHVHELAQAETDANGNLLTMSGTVQDVTVQIEAEQLLITAREEAENANRAKSQFLSSMSHELRTPMNAILGFSQLMKMDSDELNDSQVENVDEIMKAGNHLLELINEVLDLAKIEAGRIDLSIETIYLNKVLAESLQLISPLAGKRDIEINLLKDGTAIESHQLEQQPVLVRADHTRLTQVFLNLLSNAVKYNSDNGKITIAFHNTDKNLTRVSITDTGNGLSKDQQAHLFKAFDRLGAEHSDIEGTGIGLVITKNIVELMGGNIGIDSQQGKGSTFWIELASGFLPGEQDNGVNEMVSEQQPSSQKSKSDHDVLYIEDNPANLRLVSQLLGSRSNIHMWSAHEPLLGLELAAEHKPDLILLDINLPGMDGYEVLKQLRQQEVTRDTFIIAISANAMPKDIEMGMAAGFDDYITKPIDIKALLHSVDEALAGKS